MAAVLAAQAGTTLELIDTPVVTIDLAVMEQNIARLQSYLSLHGLRNRPHVKTHKIPSIARMQVAAGAAGITCQKLGEAEVMAEGGLDDILLTYNVLGEAKLERLVALRGRRVGPGDHPSSRPDPSGTHDLPDGASVRRVHG